MFINTNPRRDTFSEADQARYADPRFCDWSGKRLSRHLSVRGRLPSKPDSERVWEVYCSRCRHVFALNDSQLTAHHTQLCGH